MPKYRSTAQNKQMFGLAARAGLTHEDLRDWAAEVSNGRTEHTSKLYTNQAQMIIERLKAVVNPQVSRRTVNYRKQSVGIKTIATATHIDHLRKLARERGMTGDGLHSLCRRMLRDASGNPLDFPRTAQETNKVIEAIKKMNERDKKAANKQVKEAA